MRGRSIAIAAASTVLVSCALLSGAGDLTVGPDVAPEAGALPVEAGAESDSASDVIVADAADAADGSNGSCDEPGLVARWTFDEGDGGTVRDCTSFHHDGQVDGGNWVQGERDGGMAFDGGWVGFGNPPGLQLVGPLTACAWVRPAVLPPAAPARDYVVSKLSNPNGGGWRLALGRNTAAPPILAAMQVPDPDGGFHETAGGTMPLSAWTHVCAVFAGTTQALFVNGVQVASDATPAGRITLTNDELRVGIRADGKEPYNGAVDDVRIYSRALVVTEIAALAQP